MSTDVTHVTDKPATKLHTMDLTNGAMELIHTTLCTPGWYGEKQRNAWLACEIECNQLLDFVVPDGSEEVLAAWRDQRVAMEVTEAERECIKDCIRFYLSKAAFKPTRHLRNLLYELGLTDG